MTFMPELQRELEQINCAMGDIISMAIITTQGRVLATTAIEQESYSLIEAEHELFLLGTEILRKLRKGRYYQLIIRTSEGMVLLTDIRPDVLLITTTTPAAKYSLITMEVKQFALDLERLIP